jgi:O-antigen ligase
MTGRRYDGEALFALGLSLPLFAGGNTLLALDPAEAVYVFDVIAVVVAWQMLRSRETTEAPPPRAVLAADACLLVLASWWVGALVARPFGPRAALEAQGILCGILLFTTLSCRRLTLDTATRFVRGLLLGTLGTAALGQYQYWVVFPRAIPLAHAAGIPAVALVNANFYSANCYAAFLAGVILLATGLAISKRNAWVWIALPFLVATILLSKSRAAIVLLAVGLTALGAIGGWRPRVGGSRMATADLWVLLPAAAGAAAATVDLGELWHVATEGRISIWRGSLQIIRDHWLFGVGLGRFGASFAQFRVNDYHTLYPHSFLLEIAAELGVVGLLGLVGFLGAAFAGPVSRVVAAAARPRERLADPLWLAICVASLVLLVHGLADIDWHAPANPILLFVLLGAAQRLPTASGARES